MSAHEPIRPTGWPKPRGYANGILAAPGGRLLAVAGQIAWDTECRITSAHFPDQFGQALENVLAVVAAAGGQASHVVSLTIYVTDKEEYLAALSEVGERYRATFGHHYPAMALLEVKALLDPAAKVEIQALAVVP